MVTLWLPDEMLSPSYYDGRPQTIRTFKVFRTCEWVWVRVLNMSDSFLINTLTFIFTYTVLQSFNIKELVFIS